MVENKKMYKGWQVLSAFVVGALVTGLVTTGIGAGMQGSIKIKDQSAKLGSAKVETVTQKPVEFKTEKSKLENITINSDILEKAKKNSIIVELRTHDEGPKDEITLVDKSGNDYIFRLEYCDDGGSCRFTFPSLEDNGMNSSTTGFGKWNNYGEFEYIIKYSEHNDSGYNFAVIEIRSNNDLVVKLDTNSFANNGLKLEEKTVNQYGPAIISLINCGYDNGDVCKIETTLNGISNGIRTYKVGDEIQISNYNLKIKTLEEYKEESNRGSIEIEIK